MSRHHTAHAHHHPGHAHPPAAAGLSLLRLSVWQRLCIAAALIALMWLAVLWAV
jgi:hypothetical protein